MAEPLIGDNSAPAEEQGPAQDPKTGRFLPGNKGGGRTKMPEELRKDFRKLSPKALKVLKSILLDDEARQADRIKAAEIILDRGYGKPPQAVSVSPGDETGLGVVLIPSILDDGK